MEFLQELFGQDALTYAQLTEKLEKAGKDEKPAKLVDLTQGEYMNVEKYKNMEQERDGLKEQLSTAQATITEMEKNAADADGIKATAEQYKADAEAAKQAADEKVAAADYRVAAIEAAGAHTFTSKGARSAYIDALTKSGLPLDKGNITGLSDFNTQYKESDPDAFKDADAAPPPKIVLPSKPGAGAKDAIAAKLAKYDVKKE